MKYLFIVAICCMGWWVADIFLPLPFGGMALTLGLSTAALWLFIAWLRRSIDKTMGKSLWVDAPLDQRPRTQSWRSRESSEK